MQRYFVPKTSWHSDTHIELTNDDARHIRLIMRNKLGDEVICVRHDGFVALCRITNIESDKITLKLKEEVIEQRELPVHVTIVQALAKGNKLDLVVQKGTELGANEFTFFEADRSIVKWDSKKASKRLKRYNKIAKEASEQSGRSLIPAINELGSIESLLMEKADDHLILFAYEDEANKEKFNSLAKQLNKLQLGQKITIFIGPEGGFSDEELALFKNNDIQSVRLSPRILRTESASLYALASISYHFEEL